MTAKVLVFDLGGVVLSVAPERPIEALRSLSLRPQVLSGLWNDATKHWSHPAIDAFMLVALSREAFFERMREDLALAPDLSYDAFRDIWITVFDGREEEKGMVSLAALEALRGTGVRLIGFSNTDPIHWDYFSRHPGFAPRITALERVFVSYELKALKPQKEAFEAVQRALQLPPERLFLIDDSRTNVSAAQTLGWGAQLFTGESSLARILR